MTRGSVLRRVAAVAASCAVAGVLAAGCASPGGSPPAAPSPASAAPSPAGAAPSTVGAAPSPTGAAVAAPTCDGQGVDPAAKVRYRAERTIFAPPAVVWAEHTDVASWPQWQQAVQTNELLDPGPLEPGSRFRWTTPVPATPLTPATTLRITSTVHQVQPQQCIRWSGPAEGTGLRIDNGVHVWTFTAVPGGTRVVTEETHAGPQIEQDVPLATQFLGTGLEAWLDALKARAESPGAG